MSGSQSLLSGLFSFGTSGRGESVRPSGLFSWRFVVRLVLYFILAFLLWMVTTPAVNTVLTFCGEKIVLLFDDFDITQSIKSAGRNIIVTYFPSPDGKPWVINYRNLTFNTVFLIALIMAVPDVNYKLRLKILGLGFLILFPFQVARLVVTVFNYYGQHMEIDNQSIYPTVPRKALYYTERAMARLDGQLVPVAIWAGLFFYYKWHYKFLKRQPEGRS